MTQADPHLACPAYPECDESPNGCRVIMGDSVEEYGHKDVKQAMTLDALLNLLSAAKKGSRELDAHIWAQILPKSGVALDGLARIDGATFEYEPCPNGAVQQHVIFRGERLPYGPIGTSPRYTTSLDAVLQLVPEGWEFESLGRSGYGHDWRGKVCCINGSYRSFGGGTCFYEDHENRNIALCIACLKARQFNTKPEVPHE